MAQPVCRRCGEAIAWSSRMVVCLRVSSAGASCVPLCRGCGKELVPADPARAPDSRPHWRTNCDCTFPAPQPYAASRSDLRLFGDLLRSRGLDMSDVETPYLLQCLADTGTKLVIGHPDRHEITITAKEAEQAIGHTL